MDKKIDKVTGHDAIDALVALSLAAYEGEYEIEEHNAFIDVDDYGRGKSRDTITDYSHVMWEVLLYAREATTSDSWTIDDYFTAEVELGRFGNTDRRPLLFSIHTELVDSESRGTHFEFRYRREADVLAYNVGEGDQVLYRGEWRTVKARRYYGDDKCIIDLEGEKGHGNSFVIYDEAVLKVKRFR